MKKSVLESVAGEIGALGGRALLVGGCVRDALLGREAYDVDCEVHGLSQQTLLHLLERFGEVDKSGEAFGVYMLKAAHIDFALPRIEKRTGSGHADFAVTPLPGLDPARAAARRDFTVNAIMRDALTGEIIDPYGGVSDLQNGVLRAVPGGQFEEDPLRVLRGAQFAARFCLTPEADTLEKMRRMPLGSLSGARVMGETKKALLHSDRPDVFFRVLRDADALAPWFLELCAQTAYDRAAAMLRAAAPLRARAQEPLRFMLTALTNALKEDAAGALLGRLGAGGKAIAHCLNLRALLAPMLASIGGRGKSAYLLFDACACPRDLALLCIAAGAEEAAAMEQLALYEAAASRPMPTGGMLLAAGAARGPGMKQLLDEARKKTLLGMDAQQAVDAVLKENGKSGK